MPLNCSSAVSRFFVDVALHSNGQSGPDLRVNEVNQAAQLRGVLNLVLRLAEDDAE